MDSKNNDGSIAANSSGGQQSPPLLHESPENSNDFKSDKLFYKQWNVSQQQQQQSQSTQQPQQFSMDEVNILSNISFIISQQINNLLSMLSKKSYKQNYTDLSQIINQYGAQAEVYLFRTLVDSIDFRDQKNQQKDVFKIQLFRDEFSRLMKQPNFTSILCKAFEGVAFLNMDFLTIFSQVLKLTPPQEILLGLAVSLSLNNQSREQGEKYLNHVLSQTNIKSLPENVLHQLLYKVNMQELNNSNQSELLKYIQPLYPPNPSRVLAPYLSNDVGTSPNSKRSQDALIARLFNSNNNNNNNNNNGFPLPYQLLQSFKGTSFSSPAILKELLQPYPKLVESDLAQCIGMMAENISHPLTSTTGGSDSTNIPFLSFAPTTSSTPSSSNSNNNNSSSSSSNSSNSSSGSQSTTATPPGATSGSSTTTTTTATPPPDDSADSPLKSVWNYTVFVDVIKELYPNIDWSLVIKELDYPEFVLHDQRGLTLILAIFKRATNDKFPVNYILDNVWKNSHGQISFIKVALQSDFPFNFSQKKRIEYSALGKVSQTVAHWNSLSLIEILLNLSEIDQDHYAKTRSLFDYPLKHCPELLLMGLSSLSEKMNNLLFRELILLLFHALLFNHNYQVHISQLWKECPNIVVCGMSDIYQKDPSYLSRLLDVAQELKILTQMLSYKTYPFIIELAVLASQREFLFLERWLQERMKEDFEFVRECTQFLSDRIANQTEPNHISISSSILMSFYNTLITNVDNYPSDIANAVRSINPNFGEVNININPSDGTSTERRFPEDIEEETNLYFIKLYKEQISVEQIISTLKEYKNSQNTREHEIYKCLLFNLFDEYKFLSDYPDKELKITAYLFGSLIKNQLISSQPLRVALKYVLEAIKHQPPSNMFNFGISALISFASRLVEWPQYWSQLCSIEHFKNYSNGELVKQINTIIESTDISKSSEFQRTMSSGNLPSTNIPLQQIHDAENYNFESPDDKSMYIQVSSDNIGSQQTPQMSSSGSGSNSSTAGGSQPTQSRPHLGGLPISQKGDGGGGGGDDDDNNNNNPNYNPTGGSHKNANVDKKKDKKGESEEYSSLPIGTLVSASKEIIQPEEAVRDKMFFIINNVSMFNLDAKVKEMKDLLKPDLYDFLAQYLVIKRVSIEPNFHNVYLHFLDRMNIPDLYQQILYFTHQNIYTLLKSDKIKADHNERTLLKNLGGWLGLLTLAKNKPLLQKYFSPKDLLIYAVDHSLLVAVVPFVSKLLESCMQSRVFKPPNPWVMAIIRLMVEIYNLKESRNNIKFEIELLLNNLKLEMSEVKPSTLIKDKREEAQRLEEQENNERQRLKQQQPTAADLLQNIAQYIQYNPNIATIAQLPLFKKVVPMAFERAIKEIIAPVVERSVAIAVITSKELVSKDFATEADEKKMKKASHLMVQNLAGSLALVTCKDPLRVGMVTHLRSFLQSTSDPLPPQLEHAITTVCADNLDFACSIVERAATEKAVIDIDGVLSSSYKDRQKHKESAGQQPFFDMGYLTTSIYNNLPEPLRPKPGGIQPDQFRVYEDFLNLSHHTNIVAQSNSDSDVVGAGVVPGAIQQPISTSPPPMMMPQHMQQPVIGATGLQQLGGIGGGLQPQQQGVPTQTLPNNELLEKFGYLLNDVDKVIMRVLSTNSKIEFELLLTVVQQMYTLLIPSTSQIELIQAFAQKLFVRLCDPEKTHIYEFYFELLEVLRDWEGPKVINTLTSLLLYTQPDKKLSRILVAGLIIHQLINVNEYDQQLAIIMMDPQRSSQAIEFAVNLLSFTVLENMFAVPSEFVCITEILSKIVSAQRSPNEILVKTIEDIKNMPKEEKKRRISRFKQEEINRDPPGLKDATISLFQDWIIFSSTNSEHKMHLQYLAQVLNLNMMKNEFYFQKFFRIALEWSIEKYQASISEQLASPYIEIDALCKFVVLMVKHGDPTHLSTLTKVLALLIKVLTKDYETNITRFNQRPYLRIFENLITDLLAPDTILEPVITPIIYCFVNALATLQPLKYPGFCFAWLDIISHRSFLPKLLAKPQHKSWFHTLLIQHFKFMDPFLRGVELSEPTRFLYKGTLKILLILLHDFPEFLCEFHFSFCDVIPITCIQLRNLVLSAFPRNMRLPDPFTPNLKVDLLPDINQPPKISSNFTHSLKSLKNEVDNYLKMRVPYTFLTELKNKYLLLPENEDVITGTKYNAPLINSLVLYIGTQAIPQIQRKSNNATPTPSQSAPMDIFHRLAMDLDAEGRYLFFNAITNQLRYPNNHTHYFSCVLLYLFAEATQEIIKEQITRVLLERLISNKPHPWGLLITFIELIKNPRYNFWSHSFTRLAPEIEQLFDSVAKSCMSRESQQQQLQQTQQTPQQSQQQQQQSQQQSQK